MTNSPVPQTLEDISIRRSLLEELALKTLASEGEVSLIRLAERLRLSMGIVDALSQRLRKEQLCEVKGMIGGIHVISTTSQGSNARWSYLRSIITLGQPQYH